jgi:hypothetical protein
MTSFLLLAPYRTGGAVRTFRHQRLNKMKSCLPMRIHTTRVLSSYAPTTPPYCFPRLARVIPAATAPHRDTSYNSQHYYN